MIDMLEKMFEMQKMLNDYTFEKQGMKDDNGKLLKMKSIIDSARQDKVGANSLSNKWLGNYLTALDDESRELRDELLWKWWTTDTLNMQNVRVEIVDQLHFWMSIAMSAGMEAKDVFKVYEQKNKKNIDRQDKGYNLKDKTEADNESIDTSHVYTKSCDSCTFNGNRTALGSRCVLCDNFDNWVGK